MLVGFSVSTFNQVQAHPVPHSYVNTRPVTEHSIVRVTNASRQEAGLPPLKISTDLEASADLKNSEMDALGYFDHFSPTGGSPWRFLDQANYDYEFAGENLGEGFTNVEELETAWMDSPKHRENILDSRFTDIGVSVGDGIVVVHFGAE